MICKLVLCFLLIHIYVSSGKPVENPPVPILSQENEMDVEGKFHFSYESGDGTKVHEDGDVKQVDKEQVESVHGGWEYTAPDGQRVVVQYVADENGYQPVGDVIPKVPEAIARALKYIQEHPQKEDQ